MAYDEIKKEELIVRDYLAAERTHLANERTLLAYMRSALMLLIASITLIKLFENDRALVATGFILLPLALFVFVFGVYRFAMTRKMLRAFDSKKDDGTH